MCLGSSSTPEPVKPAVAPPAPEATPEEVITPEETETKQTERKQQKAKTSGVSAYKTTGLNLAGSTGSGLNI